jgi:hypothetical protein
VYHKFVVRRSGEDHDSLKGGLKVGGGGMREEEFRDLVFKVLEEFKGRVYRCSDVSECIDELVRELDEELKRVSDGYCFVEAHDDCGVTIACGPLETYFVTLDYDVEEIVRITECYILG